MVPLAHLLPTWLVNPHLQWLSLLPEVHEQELLVPCLDETRVSSRQRKLTWSRLCHSASAGWRPRNGTSGAASAADWWHLMMCEISNGGLVLLVLGWTLGPLRSLHASQCIAARDVDLSVTPCPELLLLLCIYAVTLSYSSVKTELSLFELLTHKVLKKYCLYIAQFDKGKSILPNWSSAWPTSLLKNNQLNKKTIINLCYVVPSVKLVQFNSEW